MRRPGRSAVYHSDQAFGAAPRPDGLAGPPVVRRIQGQPHRDVRHQDREVPGMGNSHAVLGSLRRYARQERRSVDRINELGSRGAARPQDRENHEYLLPRSTNIRRVFVDNTTTPVTFWVGSNHGGSMHSWIPGRGTPSARVRRGGAVACIPQ